MPNIELPDDQFRRLTAVAHAAGFDDVPGFIASFADDPIQDPRGTITDQQLRDNVAVMNLGDTDIATNGGIDMKEAILEIADKYDLDMKQ